MYYERQALAVQVAEKGDLRFMASRAQIIDELETLLPAWLRNRHPEWYPAYVHVLKVGSALLYLALSVLCWCMPMRLACSLPGKPE